MNKHDVSDLCDPNENTFRVQFTRFVHEYCQSSHNSFTLNDKKRDRVLKCLRDAKLESSARFRFWVRSKGFRIVQSPDGEDILAVPPKGNDPNDTLFRRVATIDDFFDIIYAAHSENGHVGQSQTFRAIKAMYALVPRILVIKFIEMCPQCSNTHSYAIKRRHSAQSSSIISADRLAGLVPQVQIQGTPFAVVKRDPEELEDFDEPEDGSTSQQEVTNALNEILTGKITGPEIDTIVHIEEDDSGTATTSVIFPCHLCKEVFPRKKALQKHIQTHQDFRPSVPLQKISPSAKKRKLNNALGFGPMFGGRPRRMGRQRIILDVDSSPSAAQAIILAASRPDVDLVAINCVAGQVSVLNACENALRVLRACGRDDVHVCRGAEKSLLGLNGKGDDNLPGMAWSRKVEGQVQAEHSVSSLIRCVNEYPGEITLVCLGPLTNLALALRLDPFVANNLKEVYIVGGNIEAQGELSCAEENFLFDPEAAYIVLQEVMDAIVLPYEIGQRHSIPFKHLVSCLNAGTEISNFLIEAVTQEELQQQAKVGVVSPEMFAVAMVIDSTIILEKEKVFATVELKGEYSRGLMVVDRRGFFKKDPNVFIVKNMDLGKTQALFGAVFSTPEIMDQDTVTLTLAGPNRESLPILFKETRMIL